MITKLLTLVFFLFFGNTPGRQWHAIQDVHRKVEVQRADTFSTAVPIVDTQGRRAFVLRCAGPKASVSDNAFVPSGDFECWLRSTKENSGYSTLLTEVDQPTRDWQSRGRFFAAEVTGACRDIPDFGRVRTFHLRGMKITVSLLNAAVVSEGTLKFHLEVDVVNDPNAYSRIAARVTPPVATRFPGCDLNRSGQY
jgi:hypothetical protein